MRTDGKTGARLLRSRTVPLFFIAHYRTIAQKDA
jgi:hypothetical protein